MPTLYYRVEIAMTPDEELRYRQDHALGPDIRTRDHIAEQLHEQILGGGVTEGWWSEVTIR